MQFSNEMSCELTYKSLALTVQLFMNVASVKNVLVVGCD